MMEWYFQIVIFFAIFANAKSKERDVERPQLYVADNNLHLIMPEERYVNVNARKVMLNNLDIIATLKQAENATKLLKTYETSISQFNSKMNDMESRILTVALSSVPNSSNNTFLSTLYVKIQQFSRRLAVAERNIRAVNKLLITNECASNPCQNGGTCVDIFNGFVCQCPTGWEGNICSTDVNECSRFMGTDLGCQNGGSCINLPGTYQCQCINGWIGMHCNRKSSDCNSGGSDICGHGTCVSQNSETGYKCICDAGWTTSATHPACTVDVDECKQNHPPCSTNPLVQCINVPGSFMCQHCPPGYTGNGYYCADINECELFNGGCSLNPYVECINTFGSKNCGPCPPGYKGDGKTCTFTGICNINNGGCNILATCAHISEISETFVQCTCPAGYSGSGIGPSGCTKTTNASRCNPNPCVHGSCAITPSTDLDGFRCDCDVGFAGTLCEERYDPCAVNPCLNGGTCIPNKRVTLFRKYFCSCMPGFWGRTCQRELQDCRETFSTSNGTLKYPYVYPYIYPLRDFQTNCGWTIEAEETKVIHVEFSKFNLADAPCTKQWFKVHNGRNGLAPVLGTFCGKTLPFNGSITTSQNVIFFSLRSISQVRKRPEFELSWTIQDAACEETLSVNGTGIIQSPGWPDSYPNNRDCFWHYNVPVTKKLLFHVYSLDIGSNSDCTGDYLEFTSLKFCNSTLPAPFHSWSNQGEIHFRSNEKEPHGGFQIGYSLVDSIPGCGGTYTLDEGYIQSIELGNLFETIICTYEIQVPIDGYLQLQFLEFDLEQSCDDTYLAIYQEASLVSKQCGNTAPSPILRIDIANGTKVILKSRSRQGYKNRWKIKYTTVCEAVLTEPFGSISPSHSSSCNILIQQPPGYIILLDFMIVVELDGAHVKVYDGNSEHSKLYAEYDRLGEKGSIHSSTNYLYIVSFNAGSSGKYITMDLGCGGLYKNDMGTIAYPPNKDEKYVGNKNCRWIIQAPPGKVVQLTWMTFNIEKSIDCSYDSVKVFDNNTDPGFGGLLGKFCGYTLPPIMLSTSNIMTIDFTSDATIFDDGFITSYTFIKESSVCGGNYFTSAGVIKSPGYPEKYPNNKECIWTISVPPGSQIMLKFTNFSLEAYSNCRYDYLEVRNGGNSAAPLIGKFCGITFPKAIPSHTNKLFIKFKSDMSKNGNGFKIEWSSTATGCGGSLNSPSGSLISPYYPEPYTKNTDCLWQITVSVGSKIRLMFVDLELEEHKTCSMDYVELFDGDTLNSKSLGKFCSRPSEAVTSTTNIMLIRFRSDVSFQGRGFNIQYSTICTNTLRGFKGVIESPNFPNDYPQDQDCNWDIIVYEGNKINISFSDFNLESATMMDNNTCRFDYVEIRYLEISPYEFETTEPTFLTYNRYCGDQNPGLLTLDSNHARIYFVSDNLLRGTGFRLEWKLFGCGGILTNTEGDIYSPNYPKPYNENVECNWLITVEFGHSVVIEFHNIDIERDYHCPHDYIEIFNGPDSTYPLITKFCHQIAPTTVSSSGNNMYVRFKSDYNLQKKGFYASYSQAPTTCGGTMSAVSGYIVSPNYPKNFNRNETCEWLISVDPHNIITLDFEDFDLESRADCKTNYVKIYDGPTQAYPVLDTICGNTTTRETIRSTYEHMLVEFRSGNYLTSKGFKAFYRKACGAIIKTSSSGIIQIRKEMFRFAYDKSVCNYTIEAEDKSKHVRLTVTNFFMATKTCDEMSPAFQIYNGFSSNSPLIGSYCDSKIAPIVSDGSALHLEIHLGLDLSLSYSVLDTECGADINLREGYIASPGYPKSYPNNLECAWNINMGPGNIVSLNVITLDIPESDNCNLDYLEIRENSSEGKLLGVFCGTTIPTNLTAVGKMLLIFKSSSLRDGFTSAKKGFYAEFSSNVLGNENILYGSKGEIGNLNYPESYPPQTKKRSWLINTNISTIIELTIEQLTLGDHYFSYGCFGNRMKIHDGMDDEAPLLKEICRQPDVTILSTSNMMYIEVVSYSINADGRYLLKWQELPKRSSKTNSLNITTTDCKYEYRLDEQSNVTLTSPGYPHGYAPSLNCEWIYQIPSQYHLAIKFSDINFGAWGNYRVCTYADVVRVYTKYEKNGKWELLREVCNNSKPTEKVVGTDLMKVEFSSNRYLNGSGFQATVFGVCGGSLTDSNGVIEFDKDHLHDKECQWNITVRVGRTIKLIFQQFDLTPDDPTRCRNYLIVRNGKFADSPFLGNGMFCGSEVPAPLESTSNYLYIKYVGSTQIKGFKIKYSEVSADCGGSYRLNEDDSYYIIQSPNYPNIPQPHVECIWTIRAPITESVRIDFEERFDISDVSRYDSPCKTDYVELKDGATEISDVIGTFCTDNPGTLFTKGNVLRVKYFTDSNEPRNGFKANVSIAQCGGTLMGAGTIRSKDLKIKRDSSCRWLLVVPPGYLIVVTLMVPHDSRIPTKVNCTADDVSKITISQLGLDYLNGSQPAESDLGTFCGKINSTEIVSSTNKVIVLYQPKTDSYSFTLDFTWKKEECSAALTQETGTLISPGYPTMSYKHHYCWWAITVPKGRRISLFIEDLDIDESTFFIIFNGIKDGPKLVDRKNIKPQTTYDTSDKNALILYWQDMPSTRRGVKITYTSDKPTVCVGNFNTTSGELHAPEGMNTYLCEYSHTTAEYETLAMKMHLTVSSNKSTNDKSLCPRPATGITILDLYVPTTFCQSTNNRYIIVRTIAPTTTIMAKQNLNTTLNFTISFETYKCGGLFAVGQTTGTISSPNFPNSSTESVECVWLISVSLSQIKVNFTTLELEDDCGRNYVEIYNGQSINDPLIGRYCKNNKPDVIISQRDNLRIEYRYEKTTNESSKGFSLEYEAHGKGCGGIYQTNEGVITSPNYKKNYDNNEECIWDIRTSEGTLINLVFFDRFYIEENVNCSKDYVEIFDWTGDTWTSLGRKCGRNVPNKINSSNNKMKVLFRSNENITATGFKAKWSIQCGGKLLAVKEENFLTSPPNINGKCTFEIESKKPNGLVSVRFLRFSLGDATHSSCSYRNLTIIGTPARLIASRMKRRLVFCGNNTPNTQIFSKTVTLNYMSSMAYNLVGGFKLAYREESCGGNISEPAALEAHISQTKIPFGHTIVCVWYITAPSDQIVVLSIHSLNTSMYSNCIGPSLYVYDGLQDRSDNRLARLCGNIDEEKPIPSSSNTMLIRLTLSNNYISSFKGEVYFTYGSTAGCGGKVNLTETKHLNLPTNLPHMDCHWTIIAPRDYKVQLEFTDIQLSNACPNPVRNYSFIFCKCSYAEVRDGAGPFAAQMTKLCTSSNGRDITLTTSWNTAYVRLFSLVPQKELFKLTLKPVESKCGGSELIAGKDFKELTSPDYPNGYPESIQCTWIIQTATNLGKIMIHFEDFDFGSSTSRTSCDGDRLEIGEGRNQEIISEGFGPKATHRNINIYDFKDHAVTYAFCDNATKPFDHYSNGKAVKLTFYSYPFSGKKGRGFKLKYALSGCNRTIDSNDGRIQHDLSSKSGANCVTVIKSDPHTTISIYFMTFYFISSDNTCSKFGLEIREGNSTGPEIFKACGFRLPNPVFSNSSQLYIRSYNLDTRRPNAYFSYNLMYLASEKKYGCGGKLFNSMGMFSSPMYPNPYREDIECTWDVIVPLNYKVALKFKDFNIGGSCLKNKLVVTTHDDEVSTDHVFCPGADAPAILYSKNSLRVTYYSSVNNGGNGWLAVFQPTKFESDLLLRI